jgi:hydroxymethylglutaryl-CoA lyase
VSEAIGKIANFSIRSISLADTVGVAAPNLISRVVQSVTSQYASYDIGVHMHSTRNDASTKVLAAYDAGCRRFDSAVGGLGGCPFAQDTLVGNIPTESVIEALEQRGVKLPLGQSLQNVLAMNSEIAPNYG